MVVGREGLVRGLGEGIVQALQGGSIRALQLAEHGEQGGQVGSAGGELAVRARLVGVRVAGREAAVEGGTEDLAVEFAHHHFAAVHVGIERGPEAERAVGDAGELLADRQFEGVEELREILARHDQPSAGARLVVVDVARVQFTLDGGAEAVESEAADARRLALEIDIDLRAEIELGAAARQVLAAQERVQGKG